MITDEKMSKEVSDLMIEIYQQMQQSVYAVRDTCPPEEYASYNRAVGRIVACILSEVLEPLYSHNPTLKPDGWDD